MTDLVTSRWRRGIKRPPELVDRLKEAKDNHATPPLVVGTALTDYESKRAVHYLKGAVQQSRWVRRWFLDQPFVAFAVSGLPASWSRLLASYCIPMVGLGPPLTSRLPLSPRWKTAMSKILVFKQVQFSRIVLLDADLTLWSSPSFAGPFHESVFLRCPAPLFCAAYGRNTRGFYRGPLRWVRGSARLFNSGFMVLSPSRAQFAWLLANFKNRTGLLAPRDLEAADQTFLWRFLVPGARSRDDTAWWELPWTYNLNCASATCFPLVNEKDARLHHPDLPGYLVLHGKPWTTASVPLNRYVRALWTETRTAVPPCPQRGFDHRAFIDQQNESQF